MLYDTTMANAMLDNDFKSSHPDLLSMTTPTNHEDDAGDTKPRAQLTTRKSVEFAILPPPPKRTRHASSVPWTAKQVVDGR
jgi:hypothetical protein